MCGRYASATTPEDLVEKLEIEEVRLEEPALTLGAGSGIGPDWNMAPTKRAPVALTRAAKGSDGPALRQLKLLTWGLVPSWAGDPGIGARMINARAETLLEKRSFTKAARERRCLVPATGWYEWAAPGTEAAAHGPSGPGKKQPYFMTRRDGTPAVFGGIYSFWKPKDAPADDPGSWLTTYAVVTTGAEEGLDRIHDRMPLVLEPEAWSAWLDPAATSDHDVLAHLEPRSPGRFRAVPVGTAVGSVRNNHPGLTDALGEDLLLDLP